MKHQRIIWYGDAQRLPNEAPAKSVPNYIEQITVMSRNYGEAKTTTIWKKIYNK